MEGLKLASNLVSKVDCMICSRQGAYSGNKEDQLVRAIADVFIALGDMFDQFRDSAVSCDQSRAISLAANLLYEHLDEKECAACGGRYLPHTLREVRNAGGKPEMQCLACANGKANVDLSFREDAAQQ